MWKHTQDKLQIRLWKDYLTAVTSDDLLNTRNIVPIVKKCMDIRDLTNRIYSFLLHDTKVSKCSSTVTPGISITNKVNKCSSNSRYLSALLLKLRMYYVYGWLLDIRHSNPYFLSIMILWYFDVFGKSQLNSCAILQLKPEDLTTIAEAVDTYMLLHNRFRHIRQAFISLGVSDNFLTRVSHINFSM